MITNREIFESLPHQPANPLDSPFEAVCGPPVALVESPFTVVDKASQFQPVEPG